MSPSLLALALLAAAVPARWPGATNQAAVPRFCDMSDGHAEVVLASGVSRGDIGSRIVAASERFLGTPYRHDPLGEGKAPDFDPTLRFDAVDCMTFVETVMALALARSTSELEPLLRSVRYDGPAQYENRNHFFSAQWVPANVRQGRLRDITFEVAGGAARVLKKTVSESQWKGRALARSIRLPLEKAPLGSVEVPYVPLAKVTEVASRIPTGALFAVVREDRPDVPIVVTHVGFVIQTARGPVVRHAGRQTYEQVVDEDLAHFVRRNARLAPWKVLGLQFLQVVEPAPDKVAEGAASAEGP